MKKKIIKNLLVLVTMMLTVSLLSLSGNEVEAAKSSVKVSAKSNTKSMGPIKSTNSAETFSTITGPSGISKVTHLWGRKFSIYVKMTIPEFMFFTLNLRLRVHYYNGKTRTVRVANGANGRMNKAWSVSRMIPDVGKHGYVVLKGEAISYLDHAISVCKEPRAAF